MVSFEETEVYTLCLSSAKARQEYKFTGLAEILLLHADIKIGEDVSDKITT